LYICLPPIEEQAEIVRILTANAGGQMIASTEAVRSVALLERLEQSILAPAFRCELVASEAEDPPVSVPVVSPKPATAAPRRGRPRAVVAA
jgi:hypothetical protein